MHTIRPRQLRLHFPLTFQDIAFPADSTAVGREASIRERQPKRFPPGWFSRSLDNPDWQREHFATWSAKRKAAGLPHVIREVA